MVGRGPAFSVIVPVFNIASHVGACLQSLVHQTETDFEALVIDDGSTDGSGDIARAMVANDPRFRVIRQENRGLSGARNTGLSEARAPLIAFLDGDDRFDPAFLDRMYHALEQTGADWAACGIRFCFPDGHDQNHPAIHGVEMTPVSEPRSLPLDDCLAIADHFPSAWNKLYRRDLIGDLRFVEGTWFEDHEWFWTLAARADRIGYLGQPLYLHSRDRPGQITMADDERGFHQFAVLDRLEPMIRGSNRRNADAAFLRLSRRLIHERGLALRSPVRRLRFLAEGRAFLARQFDKPPPASLPAVMELGTKAAANTSLAVAVIDRGDASALAATLEALRLQTLPDISVTLIGGQPGCGYLPANLPTLPAEVTLGAFLAETESCHVALLQAGERPVPDAFLHLVNGLDLYGSAFAMAGFNRGVNEQGGAGHPAGYHDGWSDNRVPGADLHLTDFAGAPRRLDPDQALWLHPSTAARVFARPLLDRITPLSVPLAHPLAPAELTLRAALGVQNLFFTPLPLAQVPFARPGQRLRPQGIARWAAALDLRGAPAPPPGWRSTLAARLFQMEIAGIGGTAARRLYLMRAGLAIRRARVRRDAAGVADPGTRWFVRAILGVGPAA